MMLLKGFLNNSLNAIRLFSFFAQGEFCNFSVVNFRETEVNLIRIKELFGIL